MLLAATSAVRISGLNSITIDCTKYQVNKSMSTMFLTKENNVIVED